MIKKKIKEKIKKKKITATVRYCKLPSCAGCKRPEDAQTTPFKERSQREKRGASSSGHRSPGIFILQGNELRLCPKCLLGWCLYRDSSTSFHGFPGSIISKPGPLFSFLQLGLFSAFLRCLYFTWPSRLIIDVSSTLFRTSTVVEDSIHTIRALKRKVVVPRPTAIRNHRGDTHGTFPALFSALAGGRWHWQTGIPWAGCRERQCTIVPWRRLSFNSQTSSLSNSALVIWMIPCRFFPPPESTRR
ncbi:hypothetical protein VTK56DRAFT_3858 [Thermocarpiscus australiensis]